MADNSRTPFKELNDGIEITLKLTNAVTEDGTHVSFIEFNGHQHLDDILMQLDEDSPPGLLDDLSPAEMCYMSIIDWLYQESSSMDLVDYEDYGQQQQQPPAEKKPKSKLKLIVNNEAQ